jgi:GcrA cell cycle regulator
MTGSTWTPERDAQLVKLWADTSLSTRRIGEAMGLNKNSVVGRAHRLQLPGRVSPIVARPAEAAPVARREEPRRAAVSPRAVLPKPAVVAPVVRGMLSPHKTCQWIDGAPAGAASRFCAEPVTVRSSYCAAHHARCWHPFQPKARAA